MYVDPGERTNLQSSEPRLRANTHPAAHTQGDPIAAGVTWLFIIGVAAMCYVQMFGHGNWMAKQEDDFFYYLKVASNFSHGLGSTFGAVHTNGYHPLWFLVLSAVTYVHHTQTELPLRIFMVGAMFASTVSTYFLSRTLLEPFSNSRVITNLLAAFSAIYAMRVLCSGMEVILTVPLILLLAVIFVDENIWARVSFKRWAGVGLLLSAIFLSRLDSALLLALLGAGVLISPRLRKTVHYPGLLLGLIPSAVYLISNRVYFKNWLPVSGSAKQLKWSHVPSLEAWRGIAPVNIAIMLIIIASLAFLPAVFKMLTTQQRILFPILLTFPFLHLLLISLLSDWRVFPWYLYGLRPALCASLCVLLLWKPVVLLVEKPFMAPLSAILLVPTMFMSQRPDGFSANCAAAAEISNFAETHPGTYAMGDNAGIVGYLLPNNLVQTEGLVMDTQFLKLIKSETPLRETLSAYHVDYYITNRRSLSSAGCYQAREPFKAGPGSPTMKGTFCEAPVADFTVNKQRYFIFDTRLQ